MGLAMSVPQLLIILVIVALIFGTKRLKEVGGDLGSAIKSFRKAMATTEQDEEPRDPKQLTATPRPSDREARPAGAPPELISAARGRRIQRGASISLAAWRAHGLASLL